MQSKKNTSSQEEQAQDTLWRIKFLLIKSKKSVEQYFDIYDKDHDGRLDFLEFEKMIQVVDKNIHPQLVGYMFNLGDFQKQGHIDIQSFSMLMDVIDIHKHKPKQIKQKEDAQQKYISCMQKLSFLKMNHQNNIINMSSILQQYPNNKQLTYKQFFEHMEQKWNVKLDDYEKVELTKIIDKKGKYNIDPEHFLKFMNVSYQQPSYPQNFGSNSSKNNNNSSNGGNNSSGGGSSTQPLFPNAQQISSQEQLQKEFSQLNPSQNKKPIFQTPVPKNDNMSKNQHQNIIGSHNNSHFTQSKIKDLDTFKQIYSQTIKSDNKFNDPQFQANHKSIQIPYNSKNYRWIRPKDIFGGKVELFQKMSSDIMQSRIGLAGGLGEYITPYDVIQGELGDCYFLSSLSSLAVDPERILNLFINPTYNKQGIYGMVLCHDGEFQAIWVDDQFPCHSHFNEPAFTKSAVSEIWVLLLEKAWAKLWGNYGKIEAGLCRDALRDLTGAPTVVIRTYVRDKDTKQQAKNEELMGKIEQAVNPNNLFIVTAGSYSEEKGLTESTATRLGLVAGHAYSIIKIVNVIHPQRGQVKLLKMRNPWAKKEWKGDWSDTSELWTPQLRQQYRIVDREDGIFFMEEKDFFKYFNDVEICYYYKNYRYNWLRLSSKKHNSQYINIKVEKSGYYYLTANQKSKRHYPDGSNYDYSQARLILIKLGPNPIFISARNIEDRETYVEGFLEAGASYLLIYKINWRFSENFESVLSSYGPGHTKLQLDSKQNYKTTLEEALKKRILQKHQNVLKPYHVNKDIQKGYELLSQEGIGFLYVQNKTTDKIMENKINFGELQGLKLRKPNRGNQIEIVVPPQSDFLAVFTVGTKGYTFKLQEEYSIKSV